MRNFLTLPIFLAGVALAGSIQRETVAEGLRDPMSIAPAPDGDVFIVEREGRIVRVHPATGAIFEVAQLQVSALRSTDPKSNSAIEDGLQGIALDPDFAKNQRLYLYYSLPDKLVDRLARFTLRDGKLNLASELPLLDIPVQRHDRICHHGGSVQFGPDGLLFLSVGDNTNPFASDGSSPTDNRENRLSWDAARSAGNTNDLRGKILRIRPTETGYEVPPGNLFPPGTAKTRPEIFVMGCRNPFRISVDSKNGTLYWGEVGPDAKDNTPKGPRGYDEVNQAKVAGNFGWPFVIADNQPYSIVDFATGKIGRRIDPAAPVNPSIRNTGLSTLPPAQPAFIWYSYTASNDFPALGSGGRNAMAGPVFYFDDKRPVNLLGSAENHTLLTYDWIRGKIWKARLGKNEELMGLGTLADGFNHPMDMEMSVDGSVWVLEYGTEWYFNRDGKLLRLTPEKPNRPPTITIERTPGNDRGFAVTSATDPDKDSIMVTWWLTDGTSETRLGTGSRVVLAATGGSEIRAVATDGKGGTAIARISLLAENVAPELTLTFSRKQKTFGANDHVPFSVTSSVTLDPSKILVRSRYIPPTGHDAGGPQFAPAANEIFTSKACFACHQIDQTSVGPAYLNVSLKYGDRPDAASYLIAKIKSGGGGVWGEVPMPPQAAANDQEVEQLVAAILELGRGVSETRGSANGEIVLANQSPAVDPAGSWEISAEAPGFKTTKVRLPVR